MVGSSPINGKTLLLATTLLRTNNDQTSFTISSLLNVGSSSYNDVSSKMRNNVDQVERILDGNTVQLRKNGIVRLAGIQMPSGTGSNFKFPSCFSYSPSYKLRQLLPRATSVQVEVVVVQSPSTTGGAAPTKLVQAILVRNEDGLMVNEELVKTGFAKVMKPRSAPRVTRTSPSLNFDLLLSLEEEARSTGLGIYTTCEPMQEPTGDGNKGKAIQETDFVAQFEPLEKTMETVWTDDGGTQRIRMRSSSSMSTTTPPTNPGDVKGCSDFATYEEALKWFETYEPYYGDVAKLDRDGDGIPCPGLPHTSDQGRYRMKVPTTSNRRTD